MEYEIAYNDSLTTFIKEVKAFAKDGFVASSIQPTVNGITHSRFFLMMERKVQADGI